MDHARCIPVRGPGHSGDRRSFNSWARTTAGAPDAAEATMRRRCAARSPAGASPRATNGAGVMPGRHHPSDRGRAPQPAHGACSKLAAAGEMGRAPGCRCHRRTRRRPRSCPRPPRRKFFPDWAGSPIPDRIDGPFVVVRRIRDSSDPTIVSSCIGPWTDTSEERSSWLTKARSRSTIFESRAKPG